MTPTGTWDAASFNELLRRRAEQRRNSVAAGAPAQPVVEVPDGATLDAELKKLGLTTDAVVLTGRGRPSFVPADRLDMGAITAAVVAGADASWVLDRGRQSPVLLVLPPEARDQAGTGPSAR